MTLLLRSLDDTFIYGSGWKSSVARPIALPKYPNDNQVNGASPRYSPCLGFHKYYVFVYSMYMKCIFPIPHRFTERPLLKAAAEEFPPHIVVTERQEEVKNGEGVDEEGGTKYIFSGAMTELAALLAQYMNFT